MKTFSASNTFGAFLCSIVIQKFSLLLIPKPKTKIPIQKYYIILGISPAATIAEIKKAYRSKAKSMHPDVNKSPNAHEQFVLLNEAYEYLTSVGSSNSSASQSNSASSQWTEQDWEEQQRENAKERAREYARMRYEEFLKSDQYKEQVVVDTVVLHLSVFFSILLLTVFPIVLFSMVGVESIIGYVLVNLILIPIHLQTYKNLKVLNEGEFLYSIAKLFLFRWFQVAVLIILNFILLFQVVIHTLVSISFIFSAYAIAVLVFKIIARNSKDKNFLSFAVAPSIISFLFLVNFVFSSNPIYEKFKVVSNGYTQNSSLIVLENDQLDDYPGVRTFFDYQEVRYANEVQYTFEYGLFGLMVMKNYKVFEN